MFSICWSDVLIVCALLVDLIAQCTHSLDSYSVWCRTQYAELGKISSKWKKEISIERKGEQTEKVSWIFLANSKLDICVLEPKKKQSDRNFGLISKAINREFLCQFDLFDVFLTMNTSIIYHSNQAKCGKFAIIFVSSVNLKRRQSDIT